MRSVQDMCSGAVDRRTFLRQMPREVKQLLTAISSARSTSLELKSAAESRDSAGVTVARDGGPESHRGVATIDMARCLAWEAGECQLCYLRCPLRDEAIVLDGGKPRIVASACDGCGVCVEACRAVNDLGAIHIVNG